MTEEQNVATAALSALSLSCRLSNDAMARMEKQCEQLRTELAYSRGVIADMAEKLRQYPPMIEKTAVELKVAA